MPSADTLERFIARVESNAHVEACEEFYTEHASMQENQGAPRVGRALHVANERKVLARARSVSSRCVRPVVHDGDRVVIRWIFRFEWLDGSVTEMEELAWQRWEGERIAEETFFYDPAQRTPRRPGADGSGAAHSGPDRTPVATPTAPTGVAAVQAPAIEAQPMIVVREVAASSRWYQSVLGCSSGHGGDEYEMLMAGGRLVLQLHHRDAHEHPHLIDPAVAALGNGVALWFHAGDFDAAVRRAASASAQVLEPAHVNPLAQHRELWLRDPDGYLVVLSGPRGDLGTGG